MIEYLRGFVPPTYTRQVHFQPEIIPAIERLATKLPKDRIWCFYSTASDPEQIGGEVVFPYYRTDGALLSCEISLSLSATAKTLERGSDHYLQAAIKAFNTVVWIEVGFGGLKAFFENKVAVHHLTIGDNNQYNQVIFDGQQEQYNRVMKQFTTARNTRDITEDDFTRFSLEYLLEQFRTP